MTQAIEWRNAGADDDLPRWGDSGRAEVMLDGVVVSGEIDIEDVVDVCVATFTADDGRKLSLADVPWRLVEAPIERISVSRVSDFLAPSIKAASKRTIGDDA